REPDDRLPRPRLQPGAGRGGGVLEGPHDEPRLGHLPGASLQGGAEGDDGRRAAPRPALGRIGGADDSGGPRRGRARLLRRHGRRPLPLPDAPRVRQERPEDLRSEPRPRADARGRGNYDPAMPTAPIVAIGGPDAARGITYGERRLATALDRLGIEPVSVTT